MNKRPLVPSFLQKIDEHLLRDKPNAWSARTHLVIWFSFLFTVALSLFCYLAFFDARQYFNIGGWVTFIGLITFIGFVFWLIFLLRFNVFKRYGNWFAWDGMKSFALYFVSIGAMVAVCFIPSAIQTYRANQQFGNDEIVNDINEINSNACKLEYDLLPLRWSADSCKIIDKTTKEIQNNTVNDVVVNNGDTSYVNRVVHFIDTAELRTKLLQADSVVKINNSLYVFFESPNLGFINVYKADEFSKAKLISSATLYRSIVSNHQTPDRVALLNRMDALKAKYATNSRYSYSSYYEENEDAYNPNENYETKIRKKYGLYRVSNGIENAVSKKYAWINDWDSYLRVFYYVTLVLTLLVFIFRHTTVKAFFLSLLTAVILTIFTGLLLVMSNGSETSVLSCMLIYYAVFAAVALSINAARVRTAIQGIGLNLFFFMTPFIPLIFVALNDAMKRNRYYETGYYTKPEVDNTALYFLIAEIAGGVIFLILLEPLFRKLYRKWYAAAED